MLTSLFAVTVVAALLLHYVFVQGPRKESKSIPSLIPQAITLSESIEDLPGSVFLQPTFTWTRQRENGEIFLGVHPLLIGLVGPTHQLELEAEESMLTKGEPLLRIRSGGREIEIFSPVDGRIVEANDAFVPQTGWQGSAKRRGSWIYRIRPEGTSRELPSWFLGAQASAWAHQQYREIRDFLFETQAHEEVGLAAADGGELPTGILSELNDKTWAEFQSRFIPEPQGEPEA